MGIPADLVTAGVAAKPSDERLRRFYPESSACQVSGKSATAIAAENHGSRMRRQFDRNQFHRVEVFSAPACRQV